MLRSSRLVDVFDRSEVDIEVLDVSEKSESELLRSEAFETGDRELDGETEDFGVMR